MITSFESVVDGVTGPELVTVGQGDEWVAPPKQPATEPSREALVWLFVRVIGT